ncbi:Hypothetical_protein [Hexamita inflata]|uniref:Hypothetical_protein n=1 Tax=Hexamita inflata TaxID=28002 RepID=A0AA86PKF0_9EUKA|nr:Hypothetical protein HINF_LOCUS24757 [Hexamita inflata]
MNDFSTVHQQLFETGRDPVAQQQSPFCKTEPEIQGQVVPEYELGSLIKALFANPTKVMDDVETDPELIYTKPQFILPFVTSEYVMLLIEHEPLFSQMKPKVFAPERVPETVRFLKEEEPRTSWTKPQLEVALVIVEKEEFQTTKLFNWLDIPQNFEIEVIHEQTKELLLIVSNSVKLFAIPQKFEIVSFEVNDKLELRILMLYSGIVATRNKVAVRSVRQLHSYLCVVNRNIRPNIEEQAEGLLGQVELAFYVDRKCGLVHFSEEHVVGSRAQISGHRIIKSEGSRKDYTGFLLERPVKDVIIAEFKLGYGKYLILQSRYYD